MSYPRPDTHRDAAIVLGFPDRQDVAVAVVDRVERVLQQCAARRRLLDGPSFLNLDPPTTPPKEQ